MLVVILLDKLSVDYSDVDDEILDDKDVRAAQVRNELVLVSGRLLIHTLCLCILTESSKLTG